MKKKVQVKFLESVAVLADPKPKAELDAKYDVYRFQMTRRPKPRSPEQIEASVEEMKRADRYGEPCYGFPRDRNFRPGELASLPEGIALAWEKCGYCELTGEQVAA